MNFGKLKRNTALISLILVTLLISACTVIRGGEDNGGTSGGGGGGGAGGAEGGGGGNLGGVDGGSPIDEEPVNVDVLIMLPLDQSPIVDYYPQLITQVVTAMELAFIFPQKVAVAPMYRQVGEETPLLWGLNDPESEFSNYTEVMDYYTSDEGLALIEDSPERQDGQNLLDLGGRLGMSTIYHPSRPAAEGRYYFDEQAEGLLVLWINPFKRRCDIGECGDQRGALVEQLTARDAEGRAAWLSLAGGARLPADRIFHLFIGTEESSDYESFVSSCADQAGFPSEILDHIEPSEHRLYGKLQGRFDEVGIPNYDIDLCDAFSTIQSTILHGLFAAELRGAMTR